MKLFDYKLWVSAGLALLLSIQLTGCVGGGNTKPGGKPDWIVNEPTKAGHVYGVGSAEIYTDEAEALRRARDAARVAMVQKLRVTVSGEFSQDTQEVRQTGKQTQLIQTVRNTIGSKIPRAELSNIEVESSYADAKKGVVYSLVKLDRVKATSQLRRQVRELDSQVDDLDKATAKTLPTLKQLQALMPALKLIAQREKLAEQAQLVDMNGRRPSKDEFLLATEKRIYALLDRLSITVEAKNAAAKGMRSGIVESLTDTGLRVSSSAGDLALKYQANLRPVEKGGRFIVFADGSVSIEDDTGRVLSEFSKEAKGVSGASAAVAQQKAVKKLAESLGQELATTLVEKIN